MAIYPTKTKKLNNRNKQLRVGISLIVIFSIILLLTVFNLLDIFTIIILGSFGLITYPICVFFIIIGILKVCKKSINVSKSLIVFLSLWMLIFTLILQMATSVNIELGFANYISTTFKSCTTAGGVVMGTLLYPIYYVTYDVATYVILAILLVIFTAIIIDKIYILSKGKKTTKVINNTVNYSEESVQEDEDSTENELSYTEEYAVKLDSIKDDSSTDEDIFISDDEENENKIDAKSILGLSKNFTESTPKNIVHEEEKEEQFTSDKPNIYVHDDNFNVFENSINNSRRSTNNTEVDIDEERRKSALAYLNISKGKFDVKNQQKGIDNVAGNNTVENASSIKIDNEKHNLTKQTNDNLNRLNNLSNRFNTIQNNQNENTNLKFNPFKENNNDIFDNSFTKAEFNENKDKFASDNYNLNKAISNLPKIASNVYSGDVKENIVDNNSFRPVQVSMITPDRKPQQQQKVYKKPPKYVRPPIELLAKYPPINDDDSDYIREKGNLIVDTLAAFRIDTKIINYTKGSTFTRYELQMAPGVSVNSVNSKVNDLSMVLESNCRVQVPIPGKNAFGIEIPNKNRVTIGLRDIIESDNFKNSKSPLTFALGKDIVNDCKVASIDKLVHTLVAGTTGSGKSVCLNTMLVSLLYKAAPDDLKLILVDPKAVEFNMFNKLPHMLIPNTITQCEKAVDALEWLVQEMERRYAKLSSLNVKKIDEYNETPEVISGSLPKMYYIVMVFDEVGDFMAISKKDIEDKVKRLAAKSRACGIHLVLATQRPTVDVITGTIKANLPSRIAFAVNTYQDSKTILESSGAEYLLGMGDMLFVPHGSNDIQRIQGCFVTNKELKSVIDFIKDNNEAEFDEEIEDQMFNKKDGFDPSNGVEDAFDPMLKDCLRYFIKSKKASASSLQGYFGIGYPKANKIVLQMEKAGFVSPQDHNGRRTLYITQQEFEERFGEDLDE